MCLYVFLSLFLRKVFTKQFVLKVQCIAKKTEI